LSDFSSPGLILSDRATAVPEFWWRTAGDVNYLRIADLCVTENEPRTSIPRQAPKSALILFQYEAPVNADYFNNPASSRIRWTTRLRCFTVSRNRALKGSGSFLTTSAAPLRPH
jgi:hypothetical protein